MRHTATLSLPGFFVAFCLVAAAASAQPPQRTFVASNGSDTNPCSRTLPCRSFQIAIDVVAPGGEVVTLDSAGYGPFTVDKAVTVAAPAGVHAGISVFSGNGITIGAGPSDVVVLRGLTLTGLGSTDGIVFTSGLALHIEGLVISGFADDGIEFNEPTHLFVKDTIVRENGGDGIAHRSGLASIEGSKFERNGTGCGVIAESGARASIRESVASGNAHGFCGSAGEINVHDSLVANNSTNGILCSGTLGIARVAYSIVTDNLTGFNNGVSAGCTFESLGNNLVRGNGTNTSGPITVVSGT